MTLFEKTNTIQTRKDEREEVMLVIKNKKKFVRGILIIILVLALLITGIVFAVSKIISLFTKKIEEIPIDSNSVVNETVSTASITPVSTSGTQNSTSSEEILKQWNLKLTNKNVPIEKDYVPELAKIEGDLKFDKRAIGYLEEMMNAIRRSGISNIWIQSSYRSYEKQAELFENKVNYYKQQGNSQEKAEQLAQRIVQRAEQSEHNLGLAVDFNKVNQEFEETEAFTWLKNNAHKYGFILRYPKGKEDITGVSYESWHWRYVGKEHAEEIHKKGICLEEYIESLKKKG